MFRLDGRAGAGKKELAWFYMGSHNLSKSAWGESQVNDSKVVSFLMHSLSLSLSSVASLVVRLGKVLGLVDSLCESKRIRACHSSVARVCGVLPPARFWHCGCCLCFCEPCARAWLGAQVVLDRASSACCACQRVLGRRRSALLFVSNSVCCVCCCSVLGLTFSTICESTHQFNCMAPSPSSAFPASRLGWSSSQACSVAVCQGPLLAGSVCCA
jgi:hypothetical protein